ncbi:FAD-binding protein [bacterium]|nr:FAD-binding protein [bacterium]
MFNKVDKRIVEELGAIVGPANVFTDAARLEAYSHDETIGVRGAPEVVVRPAATAEIAAILRLAQRERVPITPRGAGFGLSGGAVPTHGGIVLSVERMNRIIEIDAANMMVTTEPGVITGDLQRAVEAKGLFYPPDPASLDSCSIGGNVAECAGGPRAVKYGVTKDYVCGLEVVLPSGDVIESGGKLVKNVTGYNLVQLMVGSEGTLGIVTKIVLRLLPLPKVQVDLLVPFDDFGAAADTVSDIIANRILPTAIEFMERDSLKAVERLTGNAVPFSDANAHLLIQLDGNSRTAVDADLEVVGELCMANGAREVLVADDQVTRDRLWDARRKIINALNHESPMNHMEDVVVPRAEIPTLLAGVKEIAARNGVRVICFGHAGDGNVHINMLQDAIPDDRFTAMVPKVSAEFFELTLSLGGQITGEHGVGVTRRKHLPRALGQAQVDVMRRVREAFDPAGILNPGKIFP